MFEFVSVTVIGLPAAVSGTVAVEPEPKIHETNSAKK
jgi:hypothetical protein